MPQYLDNTMDDMIIQNNNQHSVYVLNSNYYGNFSQHNVAETNEGANKNSSNGPHSLVTGSGNRSCSAGSLTLEHKLCKFGNFCGIPKTIGIPVTTAPPSLSATVPTTIITPPLTRCLPPSTAIQKFFNCSNVTTAAEVKSVHALVESCRGDECGGEVEVLAVHSACQSKINSSSNNKKKNVNVKPSLIAKKTKFRTFIEQEKWGAPQECAVESEYQHSVHKTSTEFRTNSCVKESNATESTMLTPSMASCGSFNALVKHYWNGKLDGSVEDCGCERHQKRSNNWSGNSDSSNQHKHTQQQLKVWKSTQQQNSNHDLYKEATELLGLSCTLCDNCRCLECQSSYFDCDDSDSFSELSNSDEFDVETINALNNSVELVMYANCYRDDVMTNIGISTSQQEQRGNIASQFHQSYLINHAENCNGTELLESGQNGCKLSVEDENVATRKETHSAHCQQSSEVENFTSFNELSLSDIGINKGE